MLKRRRKQRYAIDHVTADDSLLNGAGRRVVHHVVVSGLEVQIFLHEVVALKSQLLLNHSVNSTLLIIRVEFY